MGKMLKYILITLLMFSAFSLYNEVYTDQEDKSNGWGNFWKKISARKNTNNKEGQEEGKSGFFSSIRQSGSSKKRVQSKPLTKIEMLDVIDKRLEVYPNIEGVIPGLTYKTKNDKRTYYYKTQEGNVIELSKLDEDSLTYIFRRINNEVTRRNTERMMKQIRRTEKLNK
jgi:hypothetical protein